MTAPAKVDSRGETLWRPAKTWTPANSTMNRIATNQAEATTRQLPNDLRLLPIFSGIPCTAILLQRTKWAHDA